jgi:hypothetical protein
VFQLSILKGERFGLLTRMATENVSFVHADENLTAFLELEPAIRNKKVLILLSAFAKVALALSPLGVSPKSST